MEYVVVWIVGLTLFFGLVFALFFVITRGTRAILGSRRRLEEELGLRSNASESDSNTLVVTGHRRFGLGHSGVVALVGSSPEARS